MIVPFRYVHHILPFESSNVGLHERVWLTREAIVFVQAEVALAPAHLRLPIVILSYMFGLWLHVAGLFGKDVERAGEVWEKCGGTPARSLTRLIRSLSMLYFAEHPHVAIAQGYPVTPQKQEKFRRLRQASLSLTDSPL